MWARMAGRTSIRGELCANTPNGVFPFIDDGVRICPRRGCHVSDPSGVYGLSENEEAEVVK